MISEEIAKKLKENIDNTVKIRINNYHYVITWGHPWYDTFEDDIYLYPVHNTCEKNLASSRINFDSYAYTHGGKTYRKAVEIAHEVQNILYPIDNTITIEEA